MAGKGGNLHKTLTLDIDVTANESSINALAAKLSKRFKDIEDNSKITINTENVKGLERLLSIFQRLDSELTDVKKHGGDVKAVLNSAFGNAIAGDVNKSIKDFSELGEKTASFVNRINGIGRDIGTKDVSNRVKLLAKDINKAFESIGSNFSINLEEFGTKDIQQQLNILVNATNKFSSTWAEGLLQMGHMAASASDSMDGLVKGAEQAAKNVNQIGESEGLSRLNKQLQEAEERLRKFSEVYKTLSNIDLMVDAKLEGINDNELESYLLKVQKEYVEAYKAWQPYHKALQSGVPNAKINPKAFERMANATLDVVKVTNSRAEKKINNKTLKNWFLDYDDKKGINSMIDDVKKFGGAIQTNLEKKVAEIRKQLEAQLKVQIDVDAEPNIEGGTKEKVKEAIDDAVPDKIEKDVKVEINSTAELDKLKNTLKEIYLDENIGDRYKAIFNEVESGAKTAEQALKEIVKAENELREAATQSWKEGYYDLQESYNSSYSASEVEEANDIADRYRNLYEEILEEKQKIEQQLKEMPVSSTNDDAITAESQKLEALKEKLLEVKAAVEQKTAAFQEEQGVVESAIGAEIQKLEALQNQLKTIISGVDADGPEASSSNVDQNSTKTGSVNGTLQSINGTLEAIKGDTSSLVAQDNNDAQKPISIENIDSIATNVAGIYGILSGGDSTLSQESVKALNNAADAMNKLVTNFESNNMGSGTSSKSGDNDEKGFDDPKELMRQSNELVNNMAKAGKVAKATIRENGTASIRTVEQLGNITRQTTGVLNKDGYEINKITDTISGKVQASLKNINSQIMNGGLDLDSSQAKAYVDAYQELENMATQFATKNGALSEQEIAQWNNQIKLVNELGNALMALMKQQNVFNADLAQKNSTKQLDDFVEKARSAGLYSNELADKVKNLRDDISNIGDADGLEKFTNGLEELKLYYDVVLEKQQEYNAVLKEFKQAEELRFKMIGLDDTTAQFKDLKQQYDALMKDINQRSQALGTGQFDTRSEMAKITAGALKENISAQAVALDKFAADAEKAGLYTSELKNKVEQLKVSLMSLHGVNQFESWIGDMQQVQKEYDDTIAAQKELNVLVKLRQDIGTKQAKMYSNTLDSNAKAGLQSEINKMMSDYQARTQKLMMNDASILNAINAAQKLSGAVQEVNQKLTEAEARSKSAFASYANAFDKITVGYNKMQDNFALLNLSDTQAESLNNYTKAYERLLEVKQKLESKDKADITSQDRQDWISATQDLSKCEKELQKILDTSEKIRSKAARPKDILEVDPSTIADLDKMQAAMKEFAQGMNLGELSDIQFDSNLKKLTATAKDSSGAIRTIEVALDSVNGAFVRSASAAKQTEGSWSKFMTSVTNKTKEMATYLLTFGSFYDIVNIVRNGVTAVREIDDALVELKKVTDATDETYANFLQTASKTSEVIGSNVRDFTNATADFARLGYTIEEAAGLAEAASVYKNVGDGIDDISQASESIISTMKAFNIEASDSMTIVDRFNEVGNNFAISSTGIGDALQRSASALFEAGNTIDESIGLITAAMKNWLFI